MIHDLVVCFYVTPLTANHLKHNKHGNDYSVSESLNISYYTMVVTFLQMLQLPLQGSQFVLVHPAK